MLTQFLQLPFARPNARPDIPDLILLSPCGAKCIHNSSPSGSVHGCSFCICPGEVAHFQLSVYGSSPDGCWSTFSSFVLRVPVQSLSCYVALGRLRMCPIKPHFRSLVVFVMDDWPVLIHNS